MNFLHPLFLLGALGVAAPILLHLRRKRRKDVREFSALRFLDEEPFPREMPRQLRDWPLFLLRALALLLLVAAFAWPFFGGSRDLVESATNIYILDNTLSHRVDGGFEKARDEIAREIRRAGSQTQVGVIEITARSLVVADLGMSHEQAAAAVAALKPTHQRGNYLDAFRIASAMLDRSLGSKRTLFVYGDRQRNQWEENVNVPPFLHDVEVVLAEPPGRKDAGNLYVANTRATRFPLPDGSGVDVMLDVGRQKVNVAAGIVMRSNGEEVLKRDLELTAADATIKSQWKAPGDGWLRGDVTISGKPDVLPLDNVSYFAVPPRDPGKIGLLARSPYLRAALDPGIARGYWDVSALKPAEIRTEAATDKPRFDVLVVESDYLQSKDARDLLLKHLNNGKGVILFVTRRTPLVEGFLRTLGFNVGAEKSLPEQEQGFRYAILQHPALQPYARPDFGDLTAVRVIKYVELSGGVAAGLLFAGDGNPVLFETTKTKGRMLLFAFGMEAAATNWPLRPDFLPFLELCLRHVRPASEKQVSVEPGGVYFREFEDGKNASFALVRDNHEMARAVADDHGRLRIAAPDEPGIYELRKIGSDGKSTMAGLVSVSTPAAESLLQYIDGRPGALDAWTLPPAPKKETAPVRLLPQTELDQRLWWWMLTIAAAFLALEMAWLCGRRSIA